VSTKSRQGYTAHLDPRGKVPLGPPGERIQVLDPGRATGPGLDRAVRVGGVGAAERVDGGGRCLLLLTSEQLLLLHANRVPQEGTGTRSEIANYLPIPEPVKVHTPLGLRIVVNPNENGVKVIDKRSVPVGITFV